MFLSAARHLHPPGSSGVGTQTEEGGTLQRGGVASEFGRLAAGTAAATTTRSTQATLFHSLKAIGRHASETVVPSIASRSQPAFLRHRVCLVKNPTTPCDSMPHGLPTLDRGTGYCTPEACPDTTVRDGSRRKTSSVVTRPVLSISLRL